MKRTWKLPLRRGCVRREATLDQRGYVEIREANDNDSPSYYSHYAVLTFEDMKKIYQKLLEAEEKVVKEKGP